MEVQYKDFVARVTRELTFEQRKERMSKWKNYLSKRTTRRSLICAGVGGLILIVAISLLASNSNKGHNTQPGEFGGKTWDPNGPLADENDSGGGRPSDDGSDSDDDEAMPVEYIDPFPLSRLDPVGDIGMYSMDRSEQLAPHVDTDRVGPNALPTNAWYQNLLETPGEPNELNRAYAVPYLVDTIGPVPGLRILPTRLITTATNVRVAPDGNFGLTLGIDYDPTSTAETTELVQGYDVVQMTNLGLTMQWQAATMKANVVRGMAFVTMMYDVFSSTFEKTFPTVASNVGLAEEPLVDGSNTMPCDNGEKSYEVNRELELKTASSDFTWLVFVSEPVKVKCFQTDPGFEIQVVETIGEGPNFSNRQLILRAALLNNCTSGSNDNYCENGEANSVDQVDGYADLLRNAAGFYPGQNTQVHFYASPDLKASTLLFDWDVQVMEAYVNQLNGGEAVTSVLDVNPTTESIVGGGGRRHLADVSADESHLTFALPHHMDQLDESVVAEPRFCTEILSGQACLVKGAFWQVSDKLVPIKYRAQRWPDPDFIPDLVDAVNDDLGFLMPWYYEEGMGDTYFSAKMLARQGRVLLIAEELRDVCLKWYPTGWDRMNTACESIKDNLPSASDIQDAVDVLSSDLSAWIDLKSSTPMVYDNSWGGVVNCGCYFDPSAGSCRNKFPDCPSAYDSFLNFGNGIYNDHHFHYGYMIYAAAVVTHFNPQWGVDNYEYVMLLIRNIANPTDLDPDFPLFRHKDWYAGHSWASGIVRPPFPNGKNQESSSEAIAAYEAVALFGDALRNADMASGRQKAVGRQLSIFGRILTTTEIRSTDRYFHVRKKDESKRVYPSGYQQNVVGILWSTAVEYTTWFGNQPYYIYGIQMLPYTPVSEFRDGLDWVMEMYDKYADACSSDPNCSSWAVLQYMALATVGHKKLAARRVKDLPPSAFQDAGGNGHSLTNSLYYIATRPEVDNPLALPQSDLDAAQGAESNVEAGRCGVSSCTKQVLDTIANGHTCRSRIHWMEEEENMAEKEACSYVSDEYPDKCGGCNPENVL